MHRPSRALQSDMAHEVKVVLEWVCDAGLDQGTRQSIAVPVSVRSFWEHAHMMSLRANDNEEFAFVFAEGLEKRLEVTDFLFKNLNQN
jgi:hypothetical protein